MIVKIISENNSKNARYFEVDPGKLQQPLSVEQIRR